MLSADSPGRSTATPFNYAMNVRSRLPTVTPRAARGSLLVLFFFFFLATSQFLQLGPQAGTPHRKLPLGGLWGRGRGAAAPGRSRKTRAAGGGRGRVPGGAGRGRAAGWRPPRTHAHASRGAPAPPRPPGEFTTPKQILTESVPFSQMMDVFSVWPPGRWGPHFPACLAGPTSRRASRCPGRSREEGLLPAVSAAATWGRGGRKAAEEKCVCVCF